VPPDETHLSRVQRNREIECAILEVAASLDERARDEFLSRTFRGDASGLADMQTLVAAARGATSFFLDARDQQARMAYDLVSELSPSEFQQAPTSPAAVEGPGTQLGHYRLTERIGEGGGGVVYAAEQIEPVQRRVAIKIVRLGMDTEGVIARFEIERQALALMDHPHIARVLDAGATASGRPYFVMELVAGEKITRYCDSRQLNITERLNLFIKVCQAIQHAHQKGIIHRDIKPSNILVAHDNGVTIPKVIDFGIAKATHSKIGGVTIFTSHDQFFGTPSYMSPEQIDLAGLDVDTRSDIYSLGVLLYEILTCRTPIDEKLLEQQGLSVFRDTLLGHHVKRPSQQLADLEKSQLQPIAKCRKMEPAQLIHHIRGDLDWIVLKALDNNRARRYQTVNDLALDLQNFLENRPISARPPSRLYPVVKFIRRNRLAVAAGTSLGLSLLAGLIISTRLYNRERIALGEQLRLKEEAQAARTLESRLRQQANARANVARVAILLNQGLLDEAEALRQEYPLSSIEPSLEAASVFRDLGGWNATQSRWDQAVQCFKLLMQANLLDTPANVMQRVDLIVVGAALLSQNPEEYLAFRQEVAERYLAPDNPLQAEHLLKACLISPADEELLRQLNRSVEVLGDPAQTPYPAWSSLALGLFQYRSRQLEAAKLTCEKALEDPHIKDSCRASILALESMIFSRLTNRLLAEEACQQAQQLIADSAGEDAVAGTSVPPSWFDWVIAEILVKEAQQEIYENR
jgi:serine/threonine protein kinase